MPNLAGLHVPQGPLQTLSIHNPQTLFCIWILTRLSSEQKGKGRHPACCHCKHLQARMSPPAAGPCLAVTLVRWQRVQDIGPLPLPLLCQRASVPVVLKLVTGHGAHPHCRLTKGLIYKVKSCCNFSLGSRERPPVLTITRRATMSQYG